MCGVALGSSQVCTGKYADGTVFRARGRIGKRMLRAPSPRFSAGTVHPAQQVHARRVGARSVCGAIRLRLAMNEPKTGPGVSGWWLGMGVPNLFARTSMRRAQLSASRSRMAEQMLRVPSPRFSAGTARQARASWLRHHLRIVACVRARTMASSSSRSERECVNGRSESIARA
jgi:hypothetical protein